MNCSIYIIFYSLFCIGASDDSVKTLKDEIREDMKFQLCSYVYGLMKETSNCQSDNALLHKAVEELKKDYEDLIKEITKVKVTY